MSDPSVTGSSGTLREPEGGGDDAAKRPSSDQLRPAGQRAVEGKDVRPRSKGHRGGAVLGDAGHREVVGGSTHVAIAERVDPAFDHRDVSVAAGKRNLIAVTVAAAAGGQAAREDDDGGENGGTNAHVSIIAGRRDRLRLRQLAAPVPLPLDWRDALYEHTFV